MLASILWLVAGVLVLVFGADAMVRGASRMALRLGLSALFVGLTVVAFATSAPELVVVVRASLQGVPDLAVGNVVGSNICNICIILGLAAVVTPIRCSRAASRRDAPLVVAATAVFMVFAADGSITRVESAILCASLVAYIAWSYHIVRRDRERVAAESLVDPDAPLRGSPFLDLLLIAMGLGALALGSDWLVTAAVDIAHHMGLSEAVIGLTIVAVGTSLPEVATSVLAAVKKEPDLALGNVLGSNLWNLLGVAGMAGLVRDLPVESRFVRFDLPVCLAVSIGLVPLMWSGARIGRAEGGALLSGYAAYVLLCLYWFTG